MLDYSQKLTSEEIWQDCFQERLLEVIAHMQQPHFQPEGLKIDLHEVMPLQGKSAQFSVVLTGREYPLVYDFNVAAVPGTSFRVTPLTEEFMMHNNPHPEGYDMNAPYSLNENGEPDLSAAMLASDLFVNYINEQITTQPLDDRVMRAEKHQSSPIKAINVFTRTAPRKELQY